MIFIQNSQTGMNRHCWLLIFLLALLSLYDLLLPQFTAPTILRQAQTAMLTENFVSEGFNISGLYLNIFGNENPLLVLEFPIYNFIVGLFFKVFGAGLFWGKLVSFLASIISLVCICRLLKDLYDDKVAVWGGLFFVFSPLGVMMRTAFQPDAVALMFLLLSLVSLRKWHYKRSAGTMILFSISLLLGGLAKFPVLVPFLPLISLTFFTKNNRFQLPDIRSIATITVIFVFPFLAWYLSCGRITDANLAYLTSDRSMFLIGDLKRFLSLFYYINPTYSIVMLGCSGIGGLFFLFGLKNMSIVEKTLLAGIPFYYVIIPTVKDQHYYLFACTPIIALFMARGWLVLAEQSNRRQFARLMPSLLIFFIVGFSCMSLYAIVLRNDTVMVDAAQAINKLSMPDDLVFTVTMHNRTAIFGGINSTFHYLSKRKGWNVDLGQFKKIDQHILAKIETQAETRRRQGAKWMIISWYTPDLESPVEAFIPTSANTRVDPGIDGRIVYQTFEKQYSTALETKNYAVLKF